MADLVSLGRRPEKVSMSANIDGNTLQRRRSMNTASIKPILKERMVNSGSNSGYKADHKMVTIDQSLTVLNDVTRVASPGNRVFINN